MSEDNMIEETMDTTETIEEIAVEETMERNWR